jgi:hypothetical protein
MGCKGSKLDDQDAVALCRARVGLLAAAMRHRYALADAHAALAGSVDAVAAPLHGLLLRLASDAPRLDLPHGRKGGGNRPAPRSSDLSQSQLPPHGHPSAHPQFGSSSGSEQADSPPCHFPQEQQPHYAYGYGYAPQPQPAFAYPAPGASTLQFYYARSRPPPPSVAVAQRAPRPPERVYFGSFDAVNCYPQYHTHGAAQAPPAAPQRASAPPSPPKASSWDFLNVFQNYDSYGVNSSSYYDPASAAVAYTPSRSSWEVREEEGIPDLEDDDEEDDAAVVKEVSGEYAGPGSGGARGLRSSVAGVSTHAEHNEPENASIAHAHAAGEARRRPLAHRNVSVPAAVPPVQRAAVGADVASEITAQFLRTADAARELAPLLEVGRPSYHGRSSVYHCELLHLVLTNGLIPRHRCICH